MAQVTAEAFFGIELTSKSKEYEWKEPDETEDDVEAKLQISHACLGANAKDGDRNIVEVTTTDFNGKEVTHTILSLKLGQSEMARMDLGFIEKVKFRLAKGNGPVHLCGSLLHAQLPISDEDDESDDEEIPALVKPTKKADAEEKPGKKDDKKPSQTEKKGSEEVGKPTAKASSVVANKSKEVTGSLDGDDESSEEDDKGLLDDEASEDDDDDDDDEEEMSEEGDELDSEEDLDDEDDDDDDDMSDEDEESEEEELEPPKSKKAKIVANGHKDNKGKPAGKKQETKAAETPKKQPDAKIKTPATADKKTPKAEKKDGKNVKTPKTPMSIEEVKSKLLKSPNLPKTAEKFKNFMKNTHKLTDEKEVQGIWDWLQKNKK